MRFNEQKLMLVTNKYGHIQTNCKHIRTFHVMLSMMVSNFEGDLTKKWPYKHRGKQLLM